MTDEDREEARASASSRLPHDFLRGCPDDCFSEHVEARCPVGDGGLGVCRTCRLAEGELTVDCPGARWEDGFIKAVAAQHNEGLMILPDVPDSSKDEAPVVRFHQWMLQWRPLKVAAPVPGVIVDFFDGAWSFEPTWPKKLLW